MLDIEDALGIQNEDNLFCCELVSELILIAVASLL